MLKTTIIFDNTEFEKKNPFLFSKKIIIMAYFLIYFDCRMYNSHLFI